MVDGMNGYGAAQMNAFLIWHKPTGRILLRGSSSFKFRTEDVIKKLKARKAWVENFYF